MTDIIKAIHKTLIELVYKHGKHFDGNYGDIGGFKLEELLADHVDSGSETGDFGSITPDGRLQLKLGTRIDSQLLRLLVQMMMGMDNAISQLIKEILHQNNAELIKMVTHAMDKGIVGAERVLRGVVEEAGNQKHLSKILSLVRKISPEVENKLSSKPFHPKPNPFPKTDPY